MNFAKRKISTAVAVATLGLTASVQNAVAQDDDMFMLEEIVVTAQKRAESVQDIPIAVSAFGGDFISEAGISDTADLIAHAPGLNGNSYSATESVFTVRGVGTAAFGIGVDSSVGVFIDDIALGRASVAASSFFDVERVEVVKGPQGTLFGRNTSAGAISVITNKPNLEENTASVKLGVGTWGQQKVEGVVNWVASDKLALRLAFVDSEMDGTFKSTTTGRELNNVDQTNIRLSALYAWNDNVETTLSVERVLERSNFGVAYTDYTALAAMGATPAFGDKSGVDYDDDGGYDAVRASSRTTWDISDTLTLVSNTGYYTNDLMFAVDADATPLAIVDLFEPQHMEQFSQEFRLNGNSGNLDWFAGLSYFRENIDASTTYVYDENILGALDALGLGTDFCALGLPTACSVITEDSLANTFNTSVALYGDVAWNITENFKLTLGGRYSRDEKEFDYKVGLTGGTINDVFATFFGAAENPFKGATPGEMKADDTWSSFDPRVALDYKLNEDVLIYASYSTGYKSGGFNQSPDRKTFDAGTQQLAGFDEEENKAIEIGVKSTLWDGRARLNVAAFRYDYSDLQIENTTDGLTFLIENAADAVTQGIELEGEVMLTESLKLSGNYTYLDAEFEDGLAGGVSIKDNTLARAPKNVGTLSADYTMDLADLGELNFRTTYTYTGKQYFDANNVHSQERYEVLGARIGYSSADDVWGLALIGENIGDTEYYQNKTFILGEVGSPALRSTYRLEFTMDL